MQNITGSYSPESFQLIKYLIQKNKDLPKGHKEFLMCVGNTGKKYFLIKK